MPTPTSSLQTATNDGTASRIGVGHRPILPVRSLLAAALLALALGGVFTGILAGRHASVAPAVRSRGITHEGLLSLPLAARGPVSAAIGADTPAYRVRASKGGFAAANPAQRFRVHFGPSGPSVRSGATRVRLSLQAVGYGASLTSLGAVTPHVKANRVTYAHAGVSEWYANGPLGLEQGFTIAKAPSGRQAGPLTLSMALSGNAHASLAAGGQSITLSRAGGPSLRYSGVSATDARGRTLRSLLELQNGRLLLRVDTRGARYPLRIDPFFQQGEKLTGAEEVRAGLFGISVALSGDGNTALVGAFMDSPNKFNQNGVGAAWVFTRSGATWTQQGEKLTGSGEVGRGDFGSSVALSGDGNTALIGGPYDDNTSGSAWVFTRSGATWTQQGEKLTGSGDVGSSWFGSSVALSADGNTALIGGTQDNNGTGAAWVFTRSGSTWTQEGEKLTGSGEAGHAEFGHTVALSGDGNTALIGGLTDNNNVGAAWVFTRKGSPWTQQGDKLTGSGEVGSGFFAYSLALSEDGNTALIGAFSDNNDVGAAWVFTRTGSTWSPQGEKLTGNGEVGGGWFGRSAALSTDGNTALIGGAEDNNGIGAAWVFSRSGSTWTQEGEKLTGNGEVGGGDFGESVALAADASTALVGGHRDNDSTGAAWVFSTTASAPAVVTGSASSVGQIARLDATVNPEGSTVSDCHFEYGTSPSYGSSVRCSSLPGSGNAPVPVSASVLRLSANTTYYFRIVATNAGGTSYGTEQTFKTAPLEAPEYGRCLKLAKGVKGRFSTGTCTSPATTNSYLYEWAPGPGPKAKFSTGIKALTAVTLESAIKEKVACAGESGTGEYTGPKTVGNVVLAFTGCEMNGIKCSSLAAHEGEVMSGVLRGTLGAVKTSTEGPVKDIVGTDLLPVAESGAVLELTCGLTSASVRGSVIVPVPRNAMRLTSNLVYAQSKGKQSPESFEGEPKDILEASFSAEPFEQTGLKLTTIQTNEEKVEVNSVV